MVVGEVWREDKPIFLWWGGSAFVFNSGEEDSELDVIWRILKNRGYPWATITIKIKIESNIKSECEEETNIQEAIHWLHCAKYL